jgi:hypothetical protein
MKSAPFFPNKARGKQNCFNHARGVCHAAPGYVEGRAVVNGRSYYREPERHVYRLAESETFDRDQALVVIAGSDRVKFAARRPYKNCVGGIRT